MTGEYLLSAGEVHGSLRIVSRAGCHARRPGEKPRAKYLCECVRCSKRSTVNESTLLAAQTDGCHRCRPAVAGKLCPRCYGMAHRRPKRKPCGCGELWKPEVIIHSAEPRNSSRGVWGLT